MFAAPALGRKVFGVMVSALGIAPFCLPKQLPGVLAKVHWPRLGRESPVGLLHHLAFGGRLPLTLEVL